MQLNLIIRDQDRVQAIWEFSCFPCCKTKQRGQVKWGETWRSLPTRSARLIWLPTMMAVERSQNKPKNNLFDSMEKQAKKTLRTERSTGPDLGNSLFAIMDNISKSGYNRRARWKLRRTLQSFKQCFTKLTDRPKADQPCPWGWHGNIKMIDSKMRWLVPPEYIESWIRVTTEAGRPDSISLKCQEYIADTES